MVKPLDEKIKSRTRKIPAKYIREVVNGQPYYYMEGVVLNIHDLLEEEDINHLLA